MMYEKHSRINTLIVSHRARATDSLEIFEQYIIAR